MPEITQIEGPAGGPDHTRRQDRSIPDDKFKKEMEPKVTKVTESDADQEAKKKKKSKQEEGVEGEDEVSAGAPPQEPLPTPFSLEATKKSMSPSELQAGEGKISPMESALPTPPAPMEAFVQEPPAYTPPSSEEIEDNAGLWEEPAAIEESPSAAQPQPPLAPYTPSYQTPETKTPEPSPSYPSREPQQSSQSPSSTSAAPPSGQVQKPSQSAQAPSKAPIEKSVSPSQTPSISPGAQQAIPANAEHMPQKAEEIAPLLEGSLPIKPQTPPPSQITQENIEEEAEEAQGIVPVTPTLVPTGVSLEPEKKKERPLEGAGPTGTVIPSEMPIPIESALAPVETPPSPFMTMSPQVIDLFERMAGVMTVMTTEGLTETSLTLNAPQFASSVFYGTQIIIQEFSTAPKAFNIQIKGTPAAIAAFHGSTNDLMAAFQQGQYTFRVNRLDTSLLEEKPLFKRKEKISGDTDDQPE